MLPTVLNCSAISTLHIERFHAQRFYVWRAHYRISPLKSDGVDPDKFNHFFGLPAAIKLMKYFAFVCKLQYNIGISPATFGVYSNFLARSVEACVGSTTIVTCVIADVQQQFSFCSFVQHFSAAISRK